MPRWMAGIVVAVNLASGCSRPDAAPEVAVPTRDSAGIRIIENVRPSWSPGTEWRLSDTPILVVDKDAPATENVPLDPATAFFNPAGELVVGDGMSNGWNKLMVYDGQGDYLRSHGRSGKGPCEFGQLWWAVPYRKDSIAALDYAEHTVSVFGLNGACARDVRLPRQFVRPSPGTYGYADGAEGVFADGSILASLMGYVDVSSGPGIVWYHHALLRIDPDGQVLDSLGIFEISQVGWNGTKQVQSPLANTALLRVHEDEFYFGTSDRYEIRVYAPNGTLGRIVRRSYEPVPIQPTHRAAYIDFVISLGSHGRELSPADAERQRAQLETESIWPETLPAFSAMLVDAESHLWIENYRWFYPAGVPPDPPPTSWSVFDRDGRWLGDVQIPGRLLLSSIERDRVVGLWKDADGVAEVRVYALGRH